MSKRLQNAVRPHPAADAGGLIESLEQRRLMSTVYYVSPTGSDTNSGTTLAAPWKTIARANQQTYQPGDSLLFQGGATFSGKLIMTAADSGTLAAPVTISSYYAGRATISAGSGDGINIDDAGGINVVNINVAGDGTNFNTSTGINLIDDQVNQPRISYIIITACDVSGFGEAGIGINSTTLTSGFNSVVITNCTVHNNNDAGIWTQAGPLGETPAPYGLAHQSIYIGYDSVYDNTGDTGNDDSGSGIALGNVNSATIEHCKAYGNGSANIATGGGPVGIWTYNSNSICIQYNQSYSNTAGHKDGGGFDIDGGTTYALLQYNYSHDNAGIGILIAQYAGASPMTNNVVRYNISQNDGRKQDQAAILLWASSPSDTIQNTLIYNNTIYLAPAASGSPVGIQILTAVRNVFFFNNIIDVAAGLDPLIVNNFAPGEVLIFRGNDYWNGAPAALNIVWGSNTSYQTLNAWQTATGEEAIGSTDYGTSVNPDLNITSTTGIPSSSDVIAGDSSFLLQSGSPLIAGGANLWSYLLYPGATDYFSNALIPNAAMNIGAD
jgi:hypothetical protein